MDIGQSARFRDGHLPAEKLHASTIKWIVALPEHLRPTELAKQFPRIPNQITLLQGDKKMCANYLAKLALDLTRDDRSGFPPEVMSEIIRLHTYYSSL